MIEWGKAGSRRLSIAKETSVGGTFVATHLKHTKLQEKSREERTLDKGYSTSGLDSIGRVNLPLAVDYKVLCLGSIVHEFAALKFI